MQDSAKRDLLIETAQRLLNQADVSTTRVNSLHDCLVSYNNLTPD